jgi:hypothetical protein
LDTRWVLTGASGLESDPVISQGKHVLPGNMEYHEQESIRFGDISGIRTRFALTGNRTLLDIVTVIYLIVFMFYLTQLQRYSIYGSMM